MKDVRLMEKLALKISLSHTESCSGPCKFLQIAHAVCRLLVNGEIATETKVFKYLQLLSAGVNEIFASPKLS